MAKCPPIILTSPTDAGRKLTRIEARPGGDTSEGWLQALLYQHPELLPVEEFDESYGPAIAVAREVPTDRGRIDNLYVSPSGGLILVETKLWKNPEKHRMVVAQIIDYAKEVATWDYDQLCSAVLSASRSQGETTTVGLEDKVRPHLEKNSAELTDFQEGIAASLEAGSFLLLIVGDRISPNIALMTKAIQSAPGLDFTIGLVEMTLYPQDDASDWPLLVVPDIVGRTVEKVRGVVQIQYKQERPSVEVEVEEDDETLQVHTGSLSVERFLDSIPKDLRSTYEDAFEKWTGIGGLIRSSAKVLHWEIDVAGQRKKVVGMGSKAVSLVRRHRFEAFSDNETLYTEYLARICKSPAIAQVVNRHKSTLRYRAISASDLAVALDAASWLLDAIRREET